MSEFGARRKIFEENFTTTVKLIDRLEDFTILESPARACRPLGHRVEGENSE